MNRLEQCVSIGSCRSLAVASLQWRKPWNSVGESKYYLMLRSMLEFSLTAKRVDHWRIF